MKRSTSRRLKTALRETSSDRREFVLLSLCVCDPDRHSGGETRHLAGDHVLEITLTASLRVIVWREQQLVPSSGRRFGGQIDFIA